MANAVDRPDLYHIFFFSVDIQKPNQDTDIPAGYFRRCGVPEYTVGVAEFREGTRLFTKKQAGIPTTTNIVLERGVVRKDTGFFKWMMSVLSGQPYKTTVVINQYHREARYSKVPDSSTEIVELTDISSKPAKRYTLYNAWPVRLKASTDLDATAEDIAVQEIEIAYEYFDVTELES